MNHRMNCPNCGHGNPRETKSCVQRGVGLEQASPASLEPAEDPVLRIAQAVYHPFAMLAGMQLDLFTPLKDGPMSAEQLADAIGVGSAKLRPLLYALVVAGLLNIEGELFANTEAANRCLVRGSRSCTVDSHEVLSDLWHAALKTAESIRTGLPQAKHDYSSMSREELQQSFRGSHPDALAYGCELVQRHDLSSCHTLLDVGGGSGGLSIAVTEACPHIQATVVDLPSVAPITQRFVEEASAGDRVRVVATDIVRDSLTGSYDIAVLSAFIQVLSRDDARRALMNVSRVVNPGGTVYIRGFGIIDNSRISPPELVAFNPVFVNVYDEGQAYTEQEYRDWLAEAGFEGFQRTSLPGGGRIITARKPR